MTWNGEPVASVIVVCFQLCPVAEWSLTPAVCWPSCPSSTYCSRPRDNSSCMPASFPHCSGTVHTAQVLYALLTYYMHCSGTVCTAQVLYALLRYCIHCSGDICTPQGLFALLRYCMHSSILYSSGNVHTPLVMYIHCSGTVRSHKVS